MRNPSLLRSASHAGSASPAFITLVCWLTACSASVRPATDRDFQRIQEYEAVVERTRGHAADARIPCRERCGSVEQLCAASAGLTSLAQTLSDRDAHARAKRPKRLCDDTRERMKACGVFTTGGAP